MIIENMAVTVQEFSQYCFSELACFAAPPAKLKKFFKIKTRRQTE